MSKLAFKIKEAREKANAMYHHIKMDYDSLKEEASRHNNYMDKTKGHVEETDQADCKGLHRSHNPDPGGAKVSCNLNTFPGTFP